MAGEQLFKKILYPTDFSESSVNSLRYVIKLSAMNKADLVLLHAYRLFGAEPTSSNLVEAKQRMEYNAKLAFEKVQKDIIKNSAVRCTFISEVGFLSDRILSSIEPLHIDLIVLCKLMQGKISDKSEGEYNGLVSRVPCPIMLMPDVLN